MQYLETSRDELADDGGCVFCAVPDREPERVLVSGTLGYVVLNKFPYNPGHLLVVPFRHTGDLEDLSAEESAELSWLMQRSVRALREESAPHGFNVGMNLGSISGAGIPDHLHWHVVPRWSGDTNFMPVLGQVRVLPELLADTARRLAPRFADA
ncbi:HIT domain-containing protein [soil metagenome]